VQGIIIKQLIKERDSVTKLPAAAINNLKASENNRI
jgi:hypothetical protein